MSRDESSDMLPSPSPLARRASALGIGVSAYLRIFFPSVAVILVAVILVLGLRVVYTQNQLKLTWYGIVLLAPEAPPGERLARLPDLHEWKENATLIVLFLSVVIAIGLADVRLSSARRRAKLKRTPPDVSSPQPGGVA